jgi:hypothetical protein
MTLLERVYKKSTEDKNLAVSALDRISMLTDVEAGRIQKVSPRMLSSFSQTGEKHNASAPGRHGHRPAIASRVELDVQRQKVKKCTPAIVRSSVSSIM